jgi:hypothetical protein
MSGNAERGGCWRRVRGRAGSPARRDGVSVTVVNPRSEFVERIRLHQLLTGSDDTVEGFGGRWQTSGRRLRGRRLRTRPILGRLW